MVTSSTPLSSQMWAAAREVYDEILIHPFLTELLSGKLDRETFGFYVIQDVHYVADFARILAAVAVRAPEPAQTLHLLERIVDLEAENALHCELLNSLGIGAATVTATPMTPAARAYADFLTATAHTRPFADALAALMACPWVYREVGETLLPQGSPDPLYQLWIDRYGGLAAAVDVPPFLELADAVGDTLTAAQRQSAVRHFVQGCRYEWMFWDMAYRRESWPV